MRLPTRILLALLPALLTACATAPPPQADSAPERKLDPDRIADAVPRNEPRSRYGNPKSYVVFGRRYHVMDSSDGHREQGIASWYGSKFHGRRTSSGEPYDMYAMTAAHKHLPLPTYVRIKNLQNGRRAVVKVNDRGPFHDNRIIDLSYAAATKLDITAGGTGVVEVRAIDPDSWRPERTPAPAATQAAAPAMQPGDAAPFSLYLQVGAFSSRQNAQKLHDTLVFLHDSVRIDAAAREEDTIYRVRIGPLASVEEADQLAARIAELGMAAPHIVVN